MPEGLQIFNAQGGLRVDLSVPVTRVIDRIEVGPNESGSRSYPGVANVLMAFAEIALWAPTAQAQQIDAPEPHRVSVSGSTVTWVPVPTTPDPGQGEGYVQGSIIRATSIVMVLAYA